MNGNEMRYGHRIHYLTGKEEEVMTLSTFDIEVTFFAEESTLCQSETFHHLSVPSERNFRLMLVPQFFYEFRLPSESQKPFGN